MISWFERRNELSWLITILIGIAIFVISSIEFDSGIGNLGVMSIIYHTCAFFFFSLFLFISVRSRRADVLVVVLMISFLYGTLDELHQYFVPGRFSSIKDVFLDSVGTLYGFMVYGISVGIRRLKTFKTVINNKE